MALRRSTIVLTYLVVATLVVATGVAVAEPTTLWRIGAADGSYEDLAIAGNPSAYATTFPRGVTFTVGKSDPARNWPFIQGGPFATMSGMRPDLFRIEFHLGDVPTGVCRLNLTYVNTHYSVPPSVEVAVNDARPYTFQAPPGITTEGFSNPRAGRPFAMPLLFPARHLRKGRNTITIAHRTGSWALYDALWLESGVPVPEMPVISSVQAQGTMFYRRIGGRLKQAVRLMLNNTAVEGDATVSLGGSSPMQKTVALVPGANMAWLFTEPVLKPTRLPVRIVVGSKEQTVEAELRPERRWRVYVAGSTHTDIGYTDLQSRVYDRLNANTMAALAACERAPDFRWNLEVAFLADLLAHHDPAAFRRLLARAAEGRIGVQGMYLNMLTGICSGEEMVHVLGRAREMGRAHGFEPVSAHINDVPTTVGTLPMLLRQLGYRYFTDAINEYRGPVFRYAPIQMQQSPFLWEGLDGSRVLAVFTRGYAQASDIGLGQSVDEVARRLPEWLRGFERPAYPGDAVLVYGAFSDNALSSSCGRLGEVANAWNREWEFPRIIVGRGDEFFRYVEGKFGTRLPVVRGDMGVYWEDGAASSAWETSLVRWARAQVETSERWLALATVREAGAVLPGQAIRDAWTSIMFYDEHTWGAAGSISQPGSEQTLQQWKVKASFATAAVKQAVAVRARGDATFGAPPLKGSVLSVANAQSWARDMVALAPAPSGFGAMRVRDLTTGRLVQSQPAAGGLLFLARGVPPVGARDFRLEPGAAPRHASVLSKGTDAWSFRTADHDLRLDPATGAIISLVDRATAKEWARGAGSQGLNQMLYVLGGGGTSMIQAFMPAPPHLRALTHQHAAVRVMENGPVRAVIEVARRGADVPDVDTYLVIHAGGALECVNVVRKAETLAKEALYFAFPFRFDAGRPIRSFVDLPYGIVEADREQAPGACREWYSASSFAASSDGVSTAYLAVPHAPLLTVGGPFRGEWRGTLGNLDGSLWSYVLNNYWDTNYKASQGGPMVFSYAIRVRPGPFSPAEATRFGWEAVSETADPRELVRRSAQELVPRPARASAPGRPHSRSLLRVTRGAAVVGGIATRNGLLVVRLYNPTSSATRCVVTLPGMRISDAWETLLDGHPGKRKARLGGGGVMADVPARSVRTLALRAFR